MECGRPHAVRTAARNHAIQMPLRSNRLKRLQNGIKRCETIDETAPDVLKSGRLAEIRRAPAGWPFRVEGKQFRLTAGRQSVMNRFTASGFRAQFSDCVSRAQKTKTITIMCREGKLQ